MQNVQTSLPMLRPATATGFGQTVGKSAGIADDTLGAGQFSLLLAARPGEEPASPAEPVAALPEEAAETAPITDEVETGEPPLPTEGKETPQAKPMTSFEQRLSSHFEETPAGSDPQSEAARPEDGRYAAPTQGVEALPGEPGADTVSYTAASAALAFPEETTPLTTGVEAMKPPGPTPTQPSSPPAASNQPAVPVSPTIPLHASPVPTETSGALSARKPELHSTAPVTAPLLPPGTDRADHVQQLSQAGQPPGDPPETAIHPPPRPEIMPMHRHSSPLPESESVAKPGPRLSPLMGAATMAAAAPPRVEPESSHSATSSEPRPVVAASGSPPLPALVDRTLPGAPSETPSPGNSVPHPSEIRGGILPRQRHAVSETPFIATSSARSKDETDGTDGKAGKETPARTNAATIAVQPASATILKAGIEPLVADAPLSAGLNSLETGSVQIGAHPMPAGREISPHHVTPATRPELPASVPGQISQAIISASGPVTELRLSPEELGTVRIELKTDQDRVTVTLLAERPETLDLLRRHADRLVAEFRAAGFSEMNLGFGNLSGGDQGETETRPEQASWEPFDSAGSSPAPMPDRRAGAQASLYLRL